MVNLEAQRKILVAAAAFRKAARDFANPFWRCNASTSQQELAFLHAAEALEEIVRELHPIEDEPYTDGGEAVIAAANFSGE